MRGADVSALPCACIHSYIPHQPIAVTVSYNERAPIKRAHTLKHTHTHTHTHTHRAAVGADCQRLDSSNGELESTSHIVKFAQ